jgi:hypothetical protein
MDNGIPAWDKDRDDDQLERAMLAYHTQELEAGHIAQQPSALDSYTFNPKSDYLHGDGQFSTDGRNYIVLKNINGVLAVYRVANDGTLERLDEEDWPGALKATAE